MMDYFQAQHVESLHAGNSELCRLYREECFYIFVSDPCLANSAKLKAFKSWNPSPPSSFGRHILSQLNQAIFFFICLPLPKSKYHGCHFIAKVVWQLENIHGICRNRLGYCLNEYLLSYVWEYLLFPIGEFIIQSFHELLECVALILPHQRWKA